MSHPELREVNIRSLAIVAGDGQHALLPPMETSWATLDPLRVILRNYCGEPLPRMQVQFVCSGTGAAHCIANSYEAVTVADGVAEWNSARATGGAGELTFAVNIHTSDGTPNTTFHATVERDRYLTATPFKAGPGHVRVRTFHAPLPFGPTCN